MIKKKIFVALIIITLVNIIICVNANAAETLITLKKVPFNITENKSVILKGVSDIDVVLGEFGNIHFATKTSQPWFVTEFFPLMNILLYVDPNTLQPGTFILDATNFNDEMLFQVGVAKEKDGQMVLSIFNGDFGLFMFLKDQHIVQLEKLDNMLRKMLIN